jgi:hypothetical protein
MIPEKMVSEKRENAFPKLPLNAASVPDLTQFQTPLPLLQMQMYNQHLETCHGEGYMPPQVMIANMMSYFRSFLKTLWFGMSWRSELQTWSHSGGFGQFKRVPRPTPLVLAVTVIDSD